jgi:hypothetical protein
MTVIQEAPSLESLLRNFSPQARGLQEILLKDEHARIAVLKSLRELTASLETPEDVVTRLVYTASEIPIDLFWIALTASKAFNLHVCESRDKLEAL